MLSSTPTSPRSTGRLGALLLLSLASAGAAQTIVDYDGLSYGATGAGTVVLHGQDGGVHWKTPWLGVPHSQLLSWWPLDATATDAGPFDSDGILSNASYALISGGAWSTHSVQMDPAQRPQIDLSAHVSKYDLLMRGSISAWVKTPSPALDMVIIGGANKSTRNKIDLRVETSVLRFDVDGELPSSGAVRGTTNIADDKWHHVAVTVEADGFARIYVDGQFEAEGQQGFFGSVFGMTGLWIGRNEFYGTWGHFKGNIDDVAIWGSVLTPVEVQQLAALPPGLVLGAAADLGPTLKGESLATATYPSSAFGTMALSPVGNRLSESTGLPAARGLSRIFDLNADRETYISCLVRRSGLSGSGCEIQLTDETGAHLRFGWDDQLNWIAGFDLSLQGPQMPSDTTYFVVCKVAASLIANDQLSFKVYAPNESVHPDESALNGVGPGIDQWTIQHQENRSNGLNALWIRPTGAVGGTVEVDEIRIGPTWESVTRLGYGSGCLGTSIGRSGRPGLGETFDVILSDASPSQLAFLNLGASRTVWRGLPLPLDLTAAGAPGCSVLASFDVTLSTTIDATGVASVSLPLPSSSSLIGQLLYLQWASVDAARTNPLPLAFSDAMELVFEK